MSDTPKPNAADTYERMEALLCEMQGLRDELVDAKFDRDNLQDQRDCSLAIIEQLKAERDSLQKRCNYLEVGRDFWRADLTEARQFAVAYRDAYLAEAFHVPPTKQQNILLELDENTLPWELPAHLQPPNRPTETPKDPQT